MGTGLAPLCGMGYEIIVLRNAQSLAKQGDPKAKRAQRHNVPTSYLITIDQYLMTNNQ